MPKQRSNAYWAERARQNKLNVINIGENGINELKRVLKTNLDEIQKEIKAFYDKYGDNPAEQLSYKEFEQYKKDLKAKAKKYPKDKTLQRMAKQDIPKYRIDRLRQLETDLQIRLAEVTAYQETSINGTLTDVAKVSHEATKKMMKEAIGLNIGAINSKQIAALILTDWSGKNWSSRLWTDREKLGKKVKQTLEKGITQGTGYRKMARELKAEMSTSFNNAFRLIRTESAFIQGDINKTTYQQAAEELGLEYYKYDAFLDSRTSEICRELDGKRFKVSEMQIGVNAPPLHPNCRSTTQLVLDDTNTINKSKATEIETVKGSNSDVGKEKKEVKTERLIKSDILKALEESNIERIPFEYYGKAISIDDIVKRLSGGDMTKGSCSSLAFAYAANRAKMKVLDFRGGKSTDFFSRNGNIESICKLRGVESFIEKAYNDYDAVEKLLKNVVNNKEYIFSTGSHTAIIRKNNKKFEYLELQTPYNNGFKPLTYKSLKDRFSCKKSHTVSGIKAKVASQLIDVETLINNPEFKTIIEYINTDKENQKKGTQGFAK